MVKVYDYDQAYIEKPELQIGDLLKHTLGQYETYYTIVSIDENLINTVFHRIAEPIQNVQFELIELNTHCWEIQKII